MKDEEIIYGEYAGGGRYLPKGFYNGVIIPREQYEGYLVSKVKSQVIAEIAQKQIETNKECFIAQWILKNPELNPDDYVLCYQTSYHQNDYRVLDGEVITSYVKMWMEKKGGI